MKLLFYTGGPNIIVPSSIDRKIIEILCHANKEKHTFLRACFSVLPLPLTTNLELGYLLSSDCSINITTFQSQQ